MMNEKAKTESELQRAESLGNKTREVERRRRRRSER